MSKHKSLWFMRGGADSVEQTQITELPPAIAAELAADTTPESVLPTSQLEALVKQNENAAVIAESEAANARRAADAAANVEANKEAAARVAREVAESDEKRLVNQKLAESSENLQHALEEKINVESKLAAIEVARGDFDDWQNLAPIRVDMAHDIKHYVENYGSAGTIFGDIGSVLKNLFGSQPPTPAVATDEKADVVANKICSYANIKTEDNSLPSSSYDNLRSTGALGAIAITGKFKSKPEFSLCKTPIPEDKEKRAHAYAEMLEMPGDVIVYKKAGSPEDRFIIKNPSLLEVVKLRLIVCNKSLTTPDAFQAALSEAASKYSDDRLDASAQKLLMALFNDAHKTLSAAEAKAILTGEQVPVESLLAQTVVLAALEPTVHQAPVVDAPVVQQPVSSSGLEIVSLPNLSDAQPASAEPTVMAGGKRKAKKPEKEYARLARKYKAKYLKAKSHAH